MVGPTYQPSVGMSSRCSSTRPCDGRALDVAPHPLVGVGVDHRADLDAGRGGVPEQQLPRAPDESLDHGVVHGVEHHQPRCRRALLAGVPERRVGGRGDGLVGVGVGIDDERVLAAQLAHDLLEVVLARLRRGGDPVDLEADRLRAGEGDDRDVGVGHQARADVLAEAGEQLEDAAGRAGRQRAPPRAATPPPASARPA